MEQKRKLNILLQRRASIGDVIMTTGVVRELKRKYGDNANIDIATDCLEVYRNNPHIRNIFPVDQIPPVNNRYDIYYNLDDAYEYNPYTNYVDNYFYRVFGDKQCNKEVELFPTEEDKKLVEQDAVSMDMPYVVIHMRNWHWQAKNIELGIWFEIFEKVFTERSDFMFVCVGNKQDHFVEGHPNFFDARDRYNSQQLKHLCDHANAFVGIDSGPFQCAAASSTRIIGLLTHLLPERIMPYRKWEFNHNAVAIQTSEDCAGCNDEQVRPIMRIVCKKGDFPCTRNFDTDLIAQEILKTL